MGQYTPKILSGETLITSRQYESLGIDTNGHNRKRDFVPVVRPNCTLYRYKDAPQQTVEYVPDGFSGILYEPFLNDVNQLIAVLAPALETALPFQANFRIDATAVDNEYVEGVVYTALATLTFSHEFVIEYQFADYWTITIVDDSDDLWE